MFKEQLFMILIMNIHTSWCALDDLYDAGKLVWKLYNIMNYIKLNNLHGANETFRDTGTIIHEITIEIDKIDELLRQMENSMHPKIIRNALESWPLNAIIAKNTDAFEIFISKIDENYVRFQRSRKTNETFREEWYLDTEDAIIMVRKIVTEGEDSPSGDLPTAITAFATIHYKEICNTPQILSNILIQMFKAVIIAEIKANIMSYVANFQQYVQNEREKGLQYVSTVSRVLFEERFGIYLNIFLINFSLIDITYWRVCDPVTGTWNRGQDYLEIEKTFQATLFRYHWYNCKYDSCHAVRVHKQYQCKPEFYDYRSSCRGLITGCFYLSAIHACALKSGPYRFQYVNSTKLGSLGTNFECPKENGYIIEDGMGWNMSYAACACNCLSVHNKISLSIMESKVESNRIIVGLRFIRLNNILYIQPKEAILGANGYIRPHTLRWINIPTNNKPSQIHQIDNENKVFFLDDLRLPPSFVLTGVKFNKVTRENVTGFALEIFGVPFDYKSGKLFLQQESKISKQASNTILGESLPFEAVSSIYSELRHQVTPSNKKYVSLKQSRLKEDFGQSTLPLFEATPILIRLPSALNGIGIFHKGVEGYAGFISLRVYGVQYEKYFQDFKVSHMKDNRVLFNDSFNH